MVCVGAHCAELASLRARDQLKRSASASVDFGMVWFGSPPPTFQLRVWWVGRPSGDEQRGEDGKEAEEEEARLNVLLSLIHI